MTKAPRLHPARQSREPHQRFLEQSFFPLDLDEAQRSFRGLPLEESTPDQLGSQLPDLMVVRLPCKAGALVPYQITGDPGEETRSGLAC